MRKKILTIVVVGMIASLFYMMNYYTPLVADDYSYSFSFSTGERITSVTQIVDSQIGHYFTINGRSITHTLAQFFLLVGESGFNYINTLFFMILLLLIYFHVYGTFKKFSVGNFSLIAMLLFLISPAFGESYLWMTGSANYLYGILIILFTLIPYRAQVRNMGKNYSILKEIGLALVMIFVAILAGWTSENTAVAMIVMMCSYIIVYRLRGCKIHLWNISGVIGGVIGCLIMLLAPGTANRLEGAGGSGGVVEWIKRFIFNSADLVVYLQLLIVVFLLVTGILLFQRYSGEKKKSVKEYIIDIKDYAEVVVYFIGFLASVYSMIVSPSFPARAWSGPVILALIMVGSISSLIDFSSMKLKMARICAIFFFIVLTSSTYLDAFYELKNLYMAYHQREAVILEAVADGEDVIEIPALYAYSKYSCYSMFGDLVSDSKTWPNTAVARYYGVDEIIKGD